MLFQIKNILSVFQYLLSIVKTPYVALIGDEDFFIQSSISDCIEFLDNNKDYVSCNGLPLSFNFNKGKIYFEYIIYL